jgi:hypothetical protein
MYYGGSHSSERHTISPMYRISFIVYRIDQEFVDTDAKLLLSYIKRLRVFPYIKSIHLTREVKEIEKRTDVIFPNSRSLETFVKNKEFFYFYINVQMNIFTSCFHPLRQLIQKFGAIQYWVSVETYNESIRRTFNILNNYAYLLN